MKSNNFTQPLVTVLIPAYNAEKTIVKTIDSVCKQSYQNLEIIIVDDGSIDSTYHIVSTYPDSRIKVIKINNSGISKALNKGLSVAKGEFVARIDSDDIAEENRITLQVQEFHNNPKLVLLGTSVSYIDDSDILLGRNFCFTNFRIIKNKLKSHNFFWHPTVMYRTEFALSVGGYEEKLSGLFEDYFFFIKLSKYGEIYNLPEALTRYRISSNQITNSHVSKDFKRLMGETIISEEITEEKSILLRSIKKRDKALPDVSEERKKNVAENSLNRFYQFLIGFGFSEYISERLVCSVKNTIAQLGFYDFTNCKIVLKRKVIK